MRSSATDVALLAILLGTYCLHTAESFILRPQQVHRYAIGENVPLQAHSVAPYNNPAKAYPFYHLPFCRPTRETAPRLRGGFLSEIFGGDKLDATPYHLPFREDVPSRELCMLVLDAAGLDKFRDALKRKFLVQAFLGNDVALTYPIGLVQVVPPNQLQQQQQDGVVHLQQGNEQQQQQQQQQQLPDGFFSQEWDNHWPSEAGTKVPEPRGTRSGGGSSEEADGDLMADGRALLEGDTYSSYYYSVADNGNPLGPTQGAASAAYGYTYWLATQYQLNIAYAGDRIVSEYVLTGALTHVDITNSSSLEVVLSYSVTWQDASAVYRYEGGGLTWRATAHLVGACLALGMLLVSGFLLLIALRRAQAEQRKLQSHAWPTDPFITQPAARHTRGNGTSTSSFLMYGSPPAGLPYAASGPGTCPTLFAAAVGTGTQLAATGLLVSCLTFTPLLSDPYDHGGLLSAYALGYTATAALGGYAAARCALQSTRGGQTASGRWQPAVALSAVLFAVPALGMLLLIRVVADGQGLLVGLSWRGLGRLAALWALGACPLAAAGGCVAASTPGRSGRTHADALVTPALSAASSGAPPRQRPTAAPWLLPCMGTAPAEALLVGGAYLLGCRTEVHLAVASLWTWRRLVEPWSVAAAAVVLAAAVACAAAALTCFHLASGGRRWRWRAFLLYGGSPSLAVLAYSLYGYQVRSQTFGTWQLPLHLAYVLLACYSQFLALGSMAYHASYAMVAHVGGGRPGAKMLVEA